MSDEQEIPQEAIEREARLMGWKPKEEFKGDPDAWRDAQEFLDFGKSVQPILRQHNDALRGEIHALRSQVQVLQNTLADSAKSMEVLKQYQADETARQIKATKRDLRARLREARESGDDRAIEQLEDQLDEVDELRDKLTTATAAPPETKPATAQEPAVHPDFAAWVNANPWYGTDQRRTRLAMVIGQELRANPANNGLVGKAFFDHVASEVLAAMPFPASAEPSSPSKVEGRRSASNQQPKGERIRSFASLPPEAKQACESLASQLVGAGKPFKTQKEWEDHYAKSYNG